MRTAARAAVGLALAVALHPMPAGATFLPAKGEQGVIFPAPGVADDLSPLAAARTMYELPPFGPARFTPNLAGTRATVRLPRVLPGPASEGLLGAALIALACAGCHRRRQR